MAGKDCGGLEAVVGIEFSPDLMRGQAHRRGERIQSGAEVSGEKLRGSVYGSSEPPGGPKRPLKMDGPVRPRAASVSEFKFGAVATEMIEDALLHLAQQNAQAVQESAGWMGSFRETRIVGVDAGPGNRVQGPGPPGHLSLRHRPWDSVQFINSHKLLYARCWG